MIEHLHRMFEAVQRVVTAGSAADWDDLGRNPKGDMVKWFDMAADGAVVEYLQTQIDRPIRLWSEEGQPRDFGDGPPEFVLVLDPVDGSRNFGRGGPLAAMAAALFPAAGPVDVQTGQYALVGNLFTNEIWHATRGEGACYQGEPIQPRAAASLAEAMFSCDFDGRGATAEVVSLVTGGHGMRSFGAATLALAMVATGQVDLHLDLRDTLTPENFLAPALIISEAGGVITDRVGQPLRPVEAMTDTFSLVAATTPALHAAVMKRLLAM